METIRSLTGENANGKAIEKILESSLLEKDFFNRKSFGLLSLQGIDRDLALTLLALYKSEVKYGYTLSQKTISHILALSNESNAGDELRRLTGSPYFLAKTCWLYEHAPYFLFHDPEQSSTRDAFILNFSKQYEKGFFKHHLPPVEWEKQEKPNRVYATTFWESKIIDPLLLLKYAQINNMEGIELSIDFHPFNFTKLLPEDFTPEKRRQIKEACFKSGIKIDIHSPIVGPYSPSPDPSLGQQNFFNPAKCLEIQYEVVELAKDIGAGSVVFHLIDGSSLKEMVKLVERAAGSDLLITIENYCQTEMRQTADGFIACIREIFNALPEETRNRNFGITIDVGHLNIEGDDPIVAAKKIGKWCHRHKVPFRLHATDNYGNLLYNPPAYSADVHSNVSGRGINNEIIIKMLRSMGHEFDVVAEQIQPLTTEDIAYIHNARSCVLDKSFGQFVENGRRELSMVDLGTLILPEILREEAYQFIVGLKGIPYLKEYLIYRKIQDKQNLSVDDAKKISRDFMKMPLKFKKDIISYIDDLLLPVQSETGVITKVYKDVIWHNISGALFSAVSNEHLNRIFSEERIYTRGEVICEENTPGHEMYLLKSGEVTVHINENLASLGPGEIFGEISLFYNTTRTASIIVTSKKARVGILTRERLKNLFEDCHPYTHDLVYRMYKILPDRLRNMNEKYKTAISKLRSLFDTDEQSLPGMEPLHGEDLQDKALFFPTLSSNEAKEIYHEVKSFDAGACILSEGDKDTGAYYIMDGKVKVVTLSEGGEEILLGELGQGEIFGEMALIDEKPRAASVITVMPCTLGFINKSSFSEFIAARSDLAFRFMNFICLSLFNHILRIDKIYSEIRYSLKSR